MDNYEPVGLAKEIFQKRYTLFNEETFAQAMDRTAGHVASAEVGEDVQKYKEEFLEILLPNLFMPGGRIIYGSGRPKGQLLNCFSGDIQDSREGWGKSVSDMIIITGTGGGLGNNFSFVRPRGTPISGTGGLATGACSLMEIHNASGEVIKAGGGRRTALMMCLDINHGDIQEFLDKKLDLKQLNNANVSVVFNINPEIFFEKVKKNQDFELVFQGKVIGKILAKKLWDKIITNAIESGEPGLLNGYYANKMSNIWYVAYMHTTNPCQPAWATLLTPDGIKTMGEIKVGDTIWSGKQWTKITNKVMTGIKSVYAYYTSHGVFYGTKNHKVLSNGVKVEVQDTLTIDSMYGTHKILSKEYINDEIVYDITVEATEHTYWTGGLLVSNCGELFLAPYDCCDLGALVLPRFIKDGEINWVLLAKTIKTAVRFLDNVLTVNNYPLVEIAQTCKNLRRIGLGVMGLHDMLLLKGLKYTSDSGLELVNKIMNFIKNTAYEASIELAKTKGPFAKFDADKFIKSNFVKTLKPSIRSAIKEHGIRNCTLLTIAPTGTTSMVCNVTSGIEPMFAPAYSRKFRDGDKLKSEVVIHPLFKQYIDNGKSVKHFQGSYDLKLRDHFEMQRICQRHLDNACSKTINIKPGTSKDELSEMYMEYLPELKGVTVYPEGSREDQPLTPMPIEEAIKYAKEAKEEATAQDSCKSGSCDI